MGPGGRHPLRGPAHQHSLSHPLTEAVSRSLPDSRPPRTAEYLALLDRRLSALSARAQGRPVSPDALGLGVRDRALARRFLGPLEATWHDGDENVVRGYLDRWTVTADDASAAAARALLEAADALPATGARAEALWFYLWEMESMLESVAR